MTQFLYGDGLAFRPATLEEFDFQIHVDVGYVDSAAVTTLTVELDANVAQVDSDYSDPYYDIFVVGSNEPILTAIDSTATLIGNRLTKNSEGICRVKASHPLLSRLVSLDMSRINFNTYRTLDSYVTGSLGRNISDNMAALASGKDATTKPIYSLQDHANSIYTRNPACWVYDLDLSGVSPWNSYNSVFRAGFAFTPLHVIMATHYLIPNGTVLRFIAMNNTVVERSIVSGDFIYGSDIYIAKLNTPLPVSITPLQFMPANESDYLPSVESWDLPMFATDAQEHAITKDNYWGELPTSVYAKNSLLYPLLTETTIGGDSGNPMFYVINGTPVAISHWSSSYRGPRYSSYLTEIADIVSTLGGGYTLSTVDLSSFTDYS